MEPQTIQQPQTIEQPHTIVETQYMEPQAIVPASQQAARGRQPAEPSTLAKQADLPMIFQDLPGDSLRGFSIGFEFQDPFNIMSLIVKNLDMPAAIRPMVWLPSIGEFFDGISPEEIRSGFRVAMTSSRNHGGQRPTSTPTGRTLGR